MAETAGMLPQADLVTMILSSGPVVKGVLVLLIVLSFWTWVITITKALEFRRAKKESEEFTNIFWESRDFSRIDDSSRRLVSSPLAHIFGAGYRELTHRVREKENAEQETEEVPSDLDTDLKTIERVLKRAEHQQFLKLENGTTFLATVASAAPFIGLFGTVWGIMTAFQGLSQAKSATIQAVAPGISEALVATAIGLAAAIPAAIAYNYFAASIKNFRSSMDRFCMEFLNMARFSL